MFELLKGVTVLDLSTVVFGPFASQMLADFGADVIKVESPDGDIFRAAAPARHRGMGAGYLNLNRNKRSISLDLKRPEGRAALDDLVREADVFLHNLAPGALARRGFGGDALREHNPGLITCEINGYGSSGPGAQKKAYDFLVQAESGICAINGTREQPARVGISICDIASGQTAFSSILRALIQRGRTGTGIDISIAMFDVMADFMNFPLLAHRYLGGAPERMGLTHALIAPYGAYPTKDGGEILISIQNEREFVRFADEVLNRPDMPSDKNFCNNEARCINRGALDKIINGAFTAIKREKLIQRLRVAKIAFGEINDVSGLSRHPALRRVKVQSHSGPVEIAAPPATFDTNICELGAVPAVGEHSEKIREEFSK